jgi:DNA invertase Pin-like site-specific DNA recombinase
MSAKSTQSQVMTSLESQRRQYDLVDVARQRGFIDVEVIADDLGRSASGTVARPGFGRLVASLCAGKIGEAERMHRERQEDQQRIRDLEMQQARYEASLAERRYAACDPDNRLIAAQLEKNWEMALRRVRDLEARQPAERSSDIPGKFAAAIARVVEQRGRRIGAGEGAVIRLADRSRSPSRPQEPPVPARLSASL